MRKQLVLVAALLPFAAFAARDGGGAAMATFGAPLAGAGVTVSTTTSSITYTFVDQTWAGFNFTQLSPDALGLGPVVGTLTSVSVDAILSASANFTYANDLTIYVDDLPLSTGGLLQVGGFSSLGAAERYLWVDGDFPNPGTPVQESYTLLTPLTFTGGPADPAIWLGNGYGAAGTSGTWSGSITLNGVAPIPEPSTWLLMALGGVGIAGFAARRRRAEG
jgi:hypothetical protein